MKKEYYKFFEEDLSDKSLDKSQKPEDIRGRLVAFLVVSMLVFSVLLGRLWFMQVIAGDSYQKQAENNRRRIIPVEAPRGYIYDRNHQVVVSNRPGVAVSVMPTVVKVNKGVIDKLAPLLGMTPKEINDKLKKVSADPLKPRIIKRDVDKKVVAYLSEHQSDFPGVDLIVETIREYPKGTLAAHALGYLGEISEEELKAKKDDGYDMGDVVGKAGLEKTYEWALRGTKGSQQVEVNAAGSPLRVLNNISPNPGHSLQLSLDAGIQETAEKALAEAIKNAKGGKDSDATAGAAVVLDPRNGEVVAMASYPTYDPRLFLGGISTKNWTALTTEGSGYPLNNRAIQAGYPCGSTFKMITGTAALGEGLINTSSVIPCSGGFSLGSYTWKCMGTHGAIEFINAIAQSCDTYFYSLGYEFYKVSLKTGQEKLQHWARDIFGLGKQTGIDLPSETDGRVPDIKWKKDFNKGFPEFQEWFPGDTVNMAIGQGDILVTPLQLATAYQAIANSGTIYKPHLVKSVVNNEGKVVLNIKPEVKSKLPITAEQMAGLRAGFKKVVSEGTAAGAFGGFPVQVAGKTGTAQVQGKKDFAWFAGYAPADDPRYIAVVVVEQGGFGGTTAAPVVRAIFAKAFNINDTSVKKTGSSGD